MTVKQVLDRNMADTATRLKVPVFVRPAGHLKTRLFWQIVKYFSTAERVPSSVGPQRVFGEV